MATIMRHGELGSLILNCEEPGYGDNKMKDPIDGVVIYNVIRYNYNNLEMS
jgi:hypothetical protein